MFKALECKDEFRVIIVDQVYSFADLAVLCCLEMKTSNRKRQL